MAADAAQGNACWFSLRPLDEGRGYPRGNKSVLLRPSAVICPALTNSDALHWFARMIGLGCMRLSTAADRDDERAVSVIRAALDAGATLLDTADAYCRDDREAGHNERLIARALAGWGGDRARITVATKGGMRRPNGA